MAATTYVCSIAHVATRLGEDPELLEAIVSNDDNLTYGNIVSVHVGHDDYITALTDDGIDEITLPIAVPIERATARPDPSAGAASLPAMRRPSQSPFISSSDV